jgi:hypothetical protein
MTGATSFMARNRPDINRIAAYRTSAREFISPVVLRG